MAVAVEMGMEAEMKQQMDWGARYRIVDAADTKRTYATADTRAELAGWLDAHSQWACTSSEREQSRVSSSYTPLAIVERQDGLGFDERSRRWIRSVRQADLMSRATPR